MMVVVLAVLMWLRVAGAGMRRGQPCCLLVVTVLCCGLVLQSKGLEDVPDNFAGEAMVCDQG